MGNSNLLGLIISLPIVAGLISFIAGWILALQHYNKKTKETPPITEKQIRWLYRQVGKTLSEQQVRQIMNSFKKVN